MHLINQWKVIFMKKILTITILLVKFYFKNSGKGHVLPSHTHGGKQSCWIVEASNDDFYRPKPILYDKMTKSYKDYLVGGFICKNVYFPHRLLIACISILKIEYNKRIRHTKEKVSHVKDHIYEM